MRNHDIIRMTRQIADFFEPYGEAETIEGVMTHLKNFWTPAMREALKKLAASDPGQLDPEVVEAAKRL